VTDTRKNGIYHYEGLPAGELSDVRELGQLCEQHDDIDLRLSWGALSDAASNPPHSILSYRDGALAGFLTMYGLADDEAEATGATRPELRRQGIFRALAEAARATCRDAGTPTLLFYVDQRSAAARPGLAALGAELAFAESKMRLADAAATAEPLSALELHRATAEDLPALAAILAGDADQDVQALQVILSHNMHKPSYQYYVAALDGDPVGTLNVQTIDGEPYIYGFVVRLEYRGRGFGREILARTLRDLAGDQPQPVYLEVEPDNTPAVNLYRSLGFEKLVTYDYYRLAV
jgi:ribosomal protein S18 acetylase RimI-like enzyme